MTCPDNWPGYQRYKNNYNWCNWSSVMDIRDELYWAGDIGRSIWLTEYGWPASSGESNQKTWLAEGLQKVGRDWGFVEKMFYFDWSDDPGYVAPSSCPSASFGLLGVDGSCNEYLRLAVDAHADWSREAQKVNVEYPSFNQALDGRNWEKITGTFADTYPYTSSQVRLVLDGTEITSYDVSYETVDGVNKWYFGMIPRDWIRELGTQSWPEHTVGLRVSYGSSIDKFYTSQSFRVLNP